MAKWYIEYKSYNKQGYAYVEANSGNDAIKIVKNHVSGIGQILKVFHDDENDDPTIVYWTK